MSKSSEMPLLGGPLHGTTVADRRVLQAAVPTTSPASAYREDYFASMPDVGLYVPTKYAICGRVVVVGIWERLSETQRDDVMWEYLASDAAKALGRRS